MFNLYDFFAGWTNGSPIIKVEDLVCPANHTNVHGTCVPDPVCLPDQVIVNGSCVTTPKVDPIICGVNQTRDANNTCVTVENPDCPIKHTYVNGGCVPNSAAPKGWAYYLEKIVEGIAGGLIAYTGKAGFDKYFGAKPEDNEKKMAERGFTPTQIALISSNQGAMAFILMATENLNDASSKEILRLAQENPEAFKHLAESFGNDEQLRVAYMGTAKEPTDDETKVRIIADTVAGCLNTQQIQPTQEQAQEQEQLRRRLERSQQELQRKLEEMKRLEELQRNQEALELQQQEQIRQHQALQDQQKQLLLRQERQRQLQEQQRQTEQQRRQKELQDSQREQERQQQDLRRLQRQEALRSQQQEEQRLVLEPQRLLALQQQYLLQQQGQKPVPPKPLVRIV